MLMNCCARVVKIYNTISILVRFDNKICTMKNALAYCNAGAVVVN
jgi:hypothetical protein